ncbi:hypothetical protein An16g06340 [Aspergillus niger]|uniref:Uncharacterized protein n=2 Tax=Aspergillus niger TaxID=5061 RepID=A2R894_ASPNC|nr:hypothetical protein An16g06340 [Aspergillus niger]CAK46968.1 hypothetical protein An16g06340 [Aspergillus niger]
MVMVKNMVAKLPGSSLDSKDRFGELSLPIMRSPGPISGLEGLIGMRSGTISPDRTQGSAGLVHPASCPKRSGDWQADTARHWLKIDSRGQEEQYAISIPYRKDLKVSVNMARALKALFTCEGHRLDQQKNT